MRLSVATNFDPALVDAVRGYPVAELFGKLREVAVGGGRAPYQLAPVSRSLDGGSMWRYLPGGNRGCEP